MNKKSCLFFFECITYAESTYVRNETVKKRPNICNSCFHVLKFFRCYSAKLFNNFSKEFVFCGNIQRVLTGISDRHIWNDGELKRNVNISCAVILKQLNETRFSFREKKNEKKSESFVGMRRLLQTCRICPLFWLKVVPYTHK